jgi:hypothetical protein
MVYKSTCSGALTMEGNRQFNVNVNTRILID